MSVITSVAELNIWDEICKEAAKMRPPFRDDDDVSVATVLEKFDASKHTPVFYGDLMHKRVSVDMPAAADFDPCVSHPACVGYAFVSRPQSASSLHCPPPPPDKNHCTAREYLEYYVFPTLLPALEALLRQAKIEKCFERNRTKFNACDFLTEYLYNNNPSQLCRESLCLGDIPFVSSWWRTHPRRPLPNSVLWSDAEAALVIQSFWQGFKVRADPGVQELRQWQREWRQDGSGGLQQTKTPSVTLDIAEPVCDTVEQNPCNCPAAESEVNVDESQKAEVGEQDAVPAAAAAAAAEQHHRCNSAGLQTNTPEQNGAESHG